MKGSFWTCISCMNYNVLIRLPFQCMGQNICIVRIIYQDDQVLENVSLTHQFVVMSFPVVDYRQVGS